MSFNGTGTFTINTAGQPVVPNTTITSTAFNLLTADLASGLTNTLTKDGQSTPTANIKMGAFKLTNVGVPTSTGDALSFNNVATISTLTLTNPLTAANGGTGITSLGTGVATALGVNVGTAGSVVVNGGALGTPSSGTVTNLTGTASININGTVGATTASTGAFTTLSASSTVSGTGFTNYFASPPALGGTAPAAVSATALSYTTTLTGGTGIVNLGSGQFYKDASGNVGIGTASPSTYGKLAVIGNIGAGNYYITDQATAQAGAFGFGNGNGPAVEAYGTTSSGAGALLFKTAVAGTIFERMRITAAGDVGIGTTSPSSYGKLAVLSASSGGIGHFETSATGLSSLNMRTTSTTGYTGLQLTSWSSWTTAKNVGQIRFDGLTSTGSYTEYAGIYADAGTNTATGAPTSLFFTTSAGAGSLERMRIDSSGNVGIGTSTGTYQLQVKGTGQETANLTDAGLKGGSLYLQAVGVGVGSGGAVLFGTTFGNATPFAAVKGYVDSGTTNTTGSLRFSTRNSISDTALTERMQIDSSGNVLVTSSGGLGYGTGSGGAVTQLTSRTTGVTLNKTNGAITMFSAAGSAVAATFTVTNSTVAISDVVVLSIRNGTNNIYNAVVTQVRSGSFDIGLYSLSGTATDAPVINFAVIKAVTA